MPYKFISADCILKLQNFVLFRNTEILSVIRFRKSRDSGSDTKIFEIIITFISNCFLHCIA